MKLLITGGAGFIGSNLARLAVAQGHGVTVVDKLTYAGNRASLADLEGKPGFAFVQADICDAEAMRRVFAESHPDKVLHLAARRARAALGWAPRADFQSGLRQTVGWYLDHPAWTQAILDGSYRLERLGKS
ncbi:MAG: hypothetical protein RLZZ162_3983 [Verrucomicrobiota bacterium]